MHPKACALLAAWVLVCWPAKVDAAPRLTEYTAPTDGQQDIPLNDFSLLLTFSEVVQANSGTITVKDGANVKSVTKCSASKIAFSNRFAIVPVVSELKTSFKHDVKIPAACFKNLDGESLSADEETLDFTTITKGTAITTYDTTSPGLAGRLSESKSIHLPLIDAWISTSESFVLLFTEAVQAGEAMVSGESPISITETRGGASAVVYETITNMSSSNVTYDATIPGRVTITPKHFRTGAEYQLSIAAGAFKDLAGNFYAGLSSDYTVRVTTSISAYNPSNGTSINVSRYSTIVLTYTDDVVSGYGLVSLCKGPWSATGDACGSYDIISTVDMHFLGRKLIINPTAFDLDPGTTYNISIPDTVVKYYQGLSASSGKAWSYSFTVGTDAADKGKPELVAGLVDCNADGDLLDNYDLDGDLTGDFLETHLDTSTIFGVPSTSKFKLYFNEKIQIPTDAGGGSLVRDDDTSVSTVSVEYGGEVDDCVMTASPSLLQGKLYTLSFGSGVIVDGLATSPNAYDGTSFTFYTRLDLGTSLTTVPADGDSGVEAGSPLRLRFTAPPRLGLDSSKLTMTIEDTSSNTVSTLLLIDGDAVKLQGNDVVIVPDPPLKSGTTYKVTLPPHSLRYMTESLSFSFSTRVVDTVKPSVVLSYPSGGMFSKLDLDSVAPWLLFSEGVSGVTSKTVRFKQGGTDKYALSSTDTECNDACVEIDSSSNNLVRLYPKGKTSGKATPWATPGVAYTVEVESGAFSDAVTTGEVQANPSESFSFVFGIYAGAAAPSVAGGVPSKDSTGVALDSSKVHLSFNSNIVGGNQNVAIKSWEHSSGAPVLTSNGDYPNGQRQTIVLTFDKVVQAGSGSLQLWDQKTTSQFGDGVAVANSEVVFAGSHVIFQLTTVLADSSTYYVKSTTGESIKNQDATAMSVPLDTIGKATYSGPMTVNFTQNAGMVGGYDVVNSSDTTLPAPIWSSLEEYTCMPANGVLADDIVLYMNEDIRRIDPGMSIKLYDCGLGCEVDGTPENSTVPGSEDSLLWTLPADSIWFIIDATKKFKVTIDMPPASPKAGSSAVPLGMGTINQLWLEPGLFQDYDDGPQKSAYYSMPFSICEVKFDTPTTTLARIYSPFKFSTSSSGYAKKFQVVIPAGCVKHDITSFENNLEYYEFAHETTAPTLDHYASRPDIQIPGSPQSHVVLAFNEVVQAGAGSFQIWEDASTDTKRFDIAVSKVKSSSSGGHSLFSGKYVSITPKTLASTSGTQTDLVSGSTYYVKTSEAGVVKDAVGNNLAAMDSQSAFKFIVLSNSGTSAKPEIAYAGGFQVSNTYAVTGYIFFTERVLSSNAALRITDCGSDMRCSAQSDNGADITDATLAFGSGSTDDGTDEYGLLTFTKTLPTNNRKYRITVPQSVATSSASQVGPSNEYSFYISLGTVNSWVSEDAVGPEIFLRIPASSATSVSAGTSISLYFNEDVQSGSGTVSFCTNADAELDGAPACDTGSFTDGQATSFGTDDATIDRRIVTFNPTQNFKAGQTLYALVPEGFISDATISSNPMREIQKNAYSFTVADEDSVEPVLQYMEPTTVSSGSIVLYFSEAVQATLPDFGQNETEFLQDASGEAIINFTHTISGNIVQISREYWTAGRTYLMDVEAAAFADLAGNKAFATVNESYSFSILADTDVPVATITPTAGSSTQQRWDVLSIDFNEAVQKGTGKVSIYSLRGGCQDSDCTGGQLLWEADVSSLPMATYVSNADNKLVSTVMLDPGIQHASGMGYALKVPETAFMDLANNVFEGLPDFSRHPFTVTTSKDSRVPSLTMVDVAGVSPNPAFAATTISMYFTDAVQSTSSGSVYLQASDGGDNCDSGSVGICSGGSTSCSNACAFNSSSTVNGQMASLTVQGAKVTAAVPQLQAGKGYKLMIDGGKFKDLAGHSLSASFDGESGDDVYVLQTLDNSDSTGPQYITNDVGTPYMFPLSGTSMVPASTTIELQFNEVIQAGSGSISITAQSGSENPRIPVSSCIYQGTQITCNPPNDLTSKQAYSVTFHELAFKDASGNSLQSGLSTDGVKGEFTVMDLDYTAPTLAAGSVSSFASRRLATATPFDPPDGAENVAKGTLVALTFSETVQAGEGYLLIKSAVSAETVDVNSVVSPQTLYWRGNSVYLDDDDLQAGNTYTVTTSGHGVFKDLSNRKAADFGAGFSFTIIDEDTVAPVLLYQMPEHSSTAQSSTDIQLVFSEPMQASATGAITLKQTKSALSGSSTSIVIPLDNSAPDLGAITVSGATVTLDPFNDQPVGDVEVTFAQGAFIDLQGNTHGGVSSSSFKFTVPELAFSVMRAHAASSSTAPPQREGALMYWINASYAMLYGGMSVGEKHCHNDLYTSTTGATWTNVAVASAEKKRSPPPVGYTQSAIDKDGCVWLLGTGQCSYLPLSYSTEVWRSCAGGSSWSLLGVPFSVTPNVEWPTSLSGHAITILGGWQLIVVDTVQGQVWRALDAIASIVELAATSVSFASRRDATLLSTSTNVLYLMAGHNCKQSLCVSNAVFADVWSSTDSGSTWIGQTANYDDSIGENSKGMGRGVAAVLAHDDTVFLIGGRRGNSTTGLNTVYSSYSGARDSTFSSSPYASFPERGATSVLKSDNITMYFRESIQSGSSSVSLVDLSSNNDVGMKTTISRQILTIAPSSPLTPGRSYRVTMPDGALKDLSGNTISSELFETYQFTVSADNTAPQVSAVTPSDGSIDVEPWTTVTLVMTEVIAKGVGNLTLNSSHGVNQTLDVNDAEIAGTRACFVLKERLTEGQLYTVGVPEGLFLDLAGNKLSQKVAATFTVMSGSVSSASDAYSGDIFPTVEVPVSEASDTTAPSLVSTRPAAGATDVPTSGVSVVFFFSEPVRFNQSGHVSILNSTGGLLTVLSVDTRDVSSLVKNGAKFRIPDTVLSTNRTFTVSIPAGVITDAAGNPAPHLSTNFTCLAGTLDRRAPQVVMVSPYKGQTGISANTTRISLWFSEKIVPGNGSLITLRRTDTATTPNTWTFSARSDAVVISGHRLDIILSTGVLNPDTGGNYHIEVPAGVVKDDGGAEGVGTLSQSSGLGGDILDFTSLAVDTTAPNLILKDPPHESSPTYGLPVSTTFQLTFSETVQASSGMLTLTPKNTHHQMMVRTQSANVALQGSIAVFAPSQDLMPGEVYTVSIGNDAFADMEGNLNAGLATGYSISTAPLMRFRTVGTSNFAATFFDGSRFGASASVDSSNNLYVVGGRNGSAYAAGALLDDVWKLETQRASHCASSFEPLTADKCKNKGGLVSTSCEGSPPTAGSASLARTVWRVPSAGGRRCYATSGEPRSLLGQEVSQKTETCACPKCKEPPAGNLPVNMINSSYLADYRLMTAGETVPLRCLKGYTPSGPFQCAYLRPYVANYSAFPKCLANNCTAPVLVNGLLNCSQSGILAKPARVCVFQNSSNSSNISEVCSTKHPIATHGETCKLSCSAGFFRRPNVTSEWSFSCDLGIVRWSSANLSSTICVTTTTTTTTTTSFVNLTANLTTTLPIATFPPPPPGQKRTFSVTGSLVLSLSLSDNVTAQDLVQNRAFVESLSKSLASGLGVATSQVDVTSIELAAASSARRLATARQLNVEYEVRVENENMANQIVAQLSDDTTKAAFQTAFVADLKTRVAASGIEGLEVTGVAVAPPTKESQLVVVPNVTNTTTIDPFAGYDAFKAGKSPDIGVADESGTNWGAVVGGLIGAGVGSVILCYLSYWYKAKQAQQQE
jgi:methionine-rich copper-binding protein CopC